MAQGSGSLFVVMLLSLAMSMLGCKEEDGMAVSALPEIIDAEMHFRGFVTDEDEELVSSIHNFSKRVVRRDTVDGKDVFVCISNRQEIFFYTDEQGAVWERSSTDIGLRVAPYGFAYRQPLIVTSWEPLLMTHDGIGTEWSVNIDTTFPVITMSGESQTLRYVKFGKARYDGWTETFVPDGYKNIPVMDAYWFALNTYIINTTTSDTLFSTEGEAHHYFAPELGGVKYITNFLKVEVDQPDIPLRGTWELMRKDIPVQQKSE